MDTADNSQDDLELVKKFEDKSRKTAKGFVVDYWGSKIDVRYYTHLTEGVLGLPLPSDGILHEFIEYLGTAVALDNAKNSVVVIELGAGFGPWIARAALMARRKGIRKITIVGVEADRLHFKWMKEHLVNNGLKSGILSSLKIDLFNKAVSQKEEFLYFPDLANPEVDWGASASNIDSDHDYRGLNVKSKKVEAIPINKLLQRYRQIDLMHVDIQGAEGGVLKMGIEELTKRTKVLVVGTHSRKIEGDLIELFFRNKWILRNEIPCKFIYNADSPSLEGMTSVDGTQIWLNPRLAS